MVLPNIKMNLPQVYMCSPSWILNPPPSSLLPPHTIPLGRPSAPAPSIQYRASNLDWRLVSYMIFFPFLTYFTLHNSLLLFFFSVFCFFFNFIFKLYNIVLVLPNIKMNPPQVYMCSPSWTLLPPPSPYHPSPYHPSGSSQCTSPKHPVSCIEPGLATHFIHDIIHVSMPLSQIFPPFPSPTESIRLL